MQNHWWKECVVYQIYPRSFKDSNGDGIGDIRGIIEKLDYLKWLGIGAVWLNPIYDSPNDDMGYDIRNYEAIMSEFGTMDDFDALLCGLHERGIKLIMDLVVNHSSDEHPWFVESRTSKDSPYRDYYIWRKGKDGREPNNWSSFFKPSAWSYDANTDEWYLHLFSEKQPDLNWENPSMREDVYAMINRWLNKGVDGFRMDVINLIAKKPGLPDGGGETDSNGYTFASEHFATQPKLHDYLKEMRKKCFDGRDCMCVGETPLVSPSEAAELVAPDRHELDMVIHFELMDIDTGTDKWDIIPFDIMRFKEIVSTWQNSVAWNSLYWNNHDQPRVLSRFGNCETEEYRVRSAKMLAAAMYLQKGTPFIFQGEEIGMTNSPFGDVAELRDIESINYYRISEEQGTEAKAWQSILKKGRDNARTPVQWTNTSNGGFTDTKPWIMVNPNYKTINTEDALSDNHSILHFYRQLIAFRNSSQALIYGQYCELIHDHKQVFAYSRTLGEEKWSVLCNMTKEIACISDIDESCGTKIVLSNMEGIQNPTLLLPYEARIIYTKTDKL